MTAAMKILIAEDERSIVKLLRYNLEKEGYRVSAAYDGPSALELAERERPDLVILDLMLPKLDGFEVCKRLRQETRVPILILTAKKAEVDRILGLELGADDYVTKPFSVRELLARVKAILRRTQPDGQEPRIFGSLEFHPGRFEARIGSRTLSLSPIEFRLLKVLIDAQGKALSRDNLLQQVWGLNREVELDTRTIDQHILRLRKKLHGESKRILTVKGMGYRFEVR